MVEPREREPEPMAAPTPPRDERASVSDDNTRPDPKRDRKPGEEEKRIERYRER